MGAFLDLVSEERRTKNALGNTGANTLEQDRALQRTLEGFSASQKANVTFAQDQPPTKSVHEAAMEAARDAYHRHMKEAGLLPESASQARMAESAAAVMSGARPPIAGAADKSRNARQTADFGNTMGSRISGQSILNSTMQSKQSAFGSPVPDYVGG